MLRVVELLLSSNSSDNVIVGLHPQLPSLSVLRDDDVPVGRSLVAALQQAHRKVGVGATLSDLIADEAVSQAVQKALALPRKEKPDVVDGLIELHHKYPEKPLVMSVSADWPEYGNTRTRLEAAGIPCFTHIERAVRALDMYTSNRLGR
jgi:acyl-CoA synthetase (NDP forming)